MNNFPTKTENIYIAILAFGLCFTPILAVFAPRALGFLPALLGIISFLSYRFFFKAWPKSGLFFFILAGAVTALAALSSLWAIVPDIALERAGKLSLILLGGAALLASIKLLPAQAISLLSRAFPWAMLLAGASCVFEMYTGGLVYKLLHSDIERFNPAALNRGTVFWVFCFWPALFFVQRLGSGTAKKTLITALALLLAAILFKADSQSAQLAFVVSAPFYFIFPAGRSWAWTALGVGLVLAVILSPWIAQTLFDNAVPLVQDMSWFQRSFAANRMEIWDFVARRALEKPLLGHGIEATRSITDFETRKIYHRHSTILHPHNFALQIWIEFGVFGVALFSAALLAALSKLRQLSVAQARLCSASFMAFLSVAATGYGMWQSWWIGAACAVSAICFWAIKAETKQ